MSNKAITWAYSQKAVKSGRKFTLVTLADMADQEHSCYPGIDMLAELTGLGRTAIMGHLDALIRAGYIAVERRHRKGGARTSNRYFLQVEAGQIHPENVSPDSEPGHQDPKSTFRADLSPDFDATKSGNRTLLKEEPPVEPKGEPSDNPLEGLDVPPTDTVPDAFDAFWAIYPRHEARKLAETRFRKALTHTPAAVIIAGAQRYADFCTAVGRSVEHIAHPSSWLNQERWHDELQIPAVVAPPPKRTNAQAAMDLVRQLEQQTSPRRNELEGASRGSDRDWPAVGHRV